MNLDRKRPARQKLVVRDLDAKHLFVHPDVVDLILAELRQFQELNTYEAPALS